MTAAKLNRIDQQNLSSNPRATLSAWRKYEKIVLSAYSTNLQGFTFEPVGISPNTLVSRVRDAIRGKIAFDYPSPISTLDLAQWFSQVIFKVVGKSVYIGPKEKLVVTLEVPDSSKTNLSFHSLSIDEVAAFALLLSNGRLSGPVVIQHPPAVDALPSYPNFHTLPRPDGSLVLL